VEKEVSADHEFGAFKGKKNRFQSEGAGRSILNRYLRMKSRRGGVIQLTKIVKKNLKKRGVKGVKRSKGKAFAPRPFSRERKKACCGREGDLNNSVAEGT